MLRWIGEHPYWFGVTLSVLGVWALLWVLWFRAWDGSYTADTEDDA